MVHSTKPRKSKMPVPFFFFFQDRPPPVFAFFIFWLLPFIVPPYFRCSMMLEGFLKILIRKLCKIARLWLPVSWKEIQGKDSAQGYWGGIMHLQGYGVQWLSGRPQEPELWRARWTWGEGRGEHSALLLPRQRLRVKNVTQTMYIQYFHKMLEKRANHNF